jgi:hypothetical protein
MGIPYNPEYYPLFLEKLGFSAVRTVLSRYMHRSHPFSEKVPIISKKVREKCELSVLNFNNRRDLRKSIHHVKALYNGSLAGTGGNPRLTDTEVKQLANQIIWFADPRLIKIFMKDDLPVGFLLAYPDISFAIRKIRGKLFPFGWVRLLFALKTTDWINVNGAGIIAEYRGSGGTAVLFDELAKSIRAGRYEQADIVQIGLENDRMQREMRSYGIDFYKTHKLYEKKIE